MVMTKRRKQERQRKTDEIIDAAEKIFFQKGFNKTTMDEIAAELELTKPALYRYFKSKEDLYFAVVLRGSEILDKMMIDNVNSKQSGIDKTLATGYAYWNFYEEYPNYSQLMTEARNINPENMDLKSLDELTKCGKNYLKIMCDVIDIGKKDDTIREDLDTFLTANFLVESTVAVMRTSETMNIALKSMKKTKEDYIKHSLDLMKHSLKKMNKLD
jgi:AcrR family transcriptional regulator